MRRHVWRRVQRNPMELTLAFIAVVTGGFRLTPPWDLTGYGLWFWLTLVVGGLVYIAGRLSDQFNLESAGLALLIGGYMFVGLRRVSTAETMAQVASYTLIYLAIAAGLMIRLRVVRKAAKANRGASGE